MAGLTPKWGTVTVPCRAVLLRLAAQPRIADQFYLAGGTALALHAGHRQSVDLDFFTLPRHAGAASAAQLAGSLRRAGVVRDLQDDGAKVDARIGGVRVTFVPYPYPLLKHPLLIRRLRVAHTHDLGVMKVSAVMSRGVRRDFIDLACLCHRYIGMRSLIRLMRKKYPGTGDISIAAAKAITDFKEADRQSDPRGLSADLKWDFVKTMLRAEARRLIQSGT